MISEIHDTPATHPNRVSDTPPDGSPRVPLAEKWTRHKATSKLINPANRRKFDIIVVDGRRRNECAIQSLSSLSGVGVFVWDNSERVRYAEGQQALIAHGFRRIDFAGRGPQLTRRWQTSIFYRDGNCLGI